MNLLHSILRGTWAIDESYALSLAPIVERILAGETVDLTHVSSKSSTTHAADAGGKTAIVSITGVIMKHDNCGDMGMKSFVSLLQVLDQDPTIHSVILDLDSGGGEASYMPNVAIAIQNFSKPIVSYYSGTCASACYYIASQTDKIFASVSTDLVGSIGTLSSFRAANPSVEQPMVTHIINATKSTEKNLEFTEALKGKYELMRTSILDPINEVFHSAVLGARPDVDKSVFTGKIMTSDKALALGLIDGIQSMAETIQYVQSNIKNMSWRFNFLRNNKQTNKKSMKDQFVKISAILGREVTDATTMSAEDWEKVNAALTVPSADSRPEAATSPALTTEQISAAVTNAVAAGLAGITASVTELKTGLSTLKAEVDIIGAKPGAAAEDKPIVSGDGKVLASWEDPNDPMWAKLDADLGKV